MQMNKLQLLGASRLSLLLAILCTLVSCVQVSLADRFSQLADEFEEAENLSCDERQQLEEEFNMLNGEFQANQSYYTSEERKEIYESIGKINGIIAKQGIEALRDGFDEIRNALPSLLDGFVSAFSDDDGKN